MSKPRQGDIVAIYNRMPSGRRFLEGEARLIHRLAVMSPGSALGDRWAVEFINEPGTTYERHVARGADAGVGVKVSGQGAKKC